MQNKSFLEKFNKFIPDHDQISILSTIEDYSLKVSKEARIIEARIQFPALVNKSKLYGIERSIASAYDLRYFKILPKYPEQLLTYDYIPQILIETETIGIVAKGFFGDYTYTFNGDKLDISIPFTKGGVMLLQNADTPRVIENIIFSEFERRVSVSISHTKEDDGGYSDFMKRELEALDKHLMNAQVQYDKYQAQRGYENEQSSAPVEDDKPKLPRLQSVYSEGVSPIVENGICTIGHSKFDISEPKYVIGEPFEVIPTAISYISKPIRNVVILGKVFGVSSETN